MRKTTKKFSAATIVAIFIVLIRPERLLEPFWGGGSWEFQLPGLVPIAFEPMGWWRALTIPLLAAMALRRPHWTHWTAGALFACIWILSPYAGIGTLGFFLLLSPVSCLIGKAGGVEAKEALRYCLYCLKKVALVAGLTTEVFYPLAGLLTSIIALAMIEGASQIFLALKDVWEGIKDFLGGVRFLVS